jgi:hypothetical protein
LSDPLDGALWPLPQDAAGNLEPAKDESAQRIDGIIALSWPAVTSTLAALRTGIRIAQSFED